MEQTITIFNDKWKLISYDGESHTNKDKKTIYLNEKHIFNMIVVGHELSHAFYLYYYENVKFDGYNDHTEKIAVLMGKIIGKIYEMTLTITRNWR